MSKICWSFLDFLSGFYVEVLADDFADYACLIFDFSILICKFWCFLIEVALIASMKSWNCSFVFLEWDRGDILMLFLVVMWSFTDVFINIELCGWYSSIDPTSLTDGYLLSVNQVFFLSLDYTPPFIEVMVLKLMDYLLMGVQYDLGCTSLKSKPIEDYSFSVKNWLEFIA